MRFQILEKATRMLLERSQLGANQNERKECERAAEMMPTCNKYSQDFSDPLKENTGERIKVSIPHTQDYTRTKYKHHIF
jgi:hypothetical protein